MASSKLQLRNAAGLSMHRLPPPGAHRLSLGARSTAPLAGASFPMRSDESAALAGSKCRGC
eukprot:11638286-Alexandrium_andersonii.AAC.1